jgi:hypothetical protein
LLLDGLHIVEGLQHCLHQLVLGVEQLFKVSVVGVVVVVVVVVAGWPLHWLFLVFTICQFGKKGE